MAESDRDRMLSIFAVLFGLLALSNFLKPIPLTEDTGFVLFGRRLSGVSSAIAGVAFGVYLLVYAAGIWRMRRHALPMGYGYAAYVLLNVVLFNVRNPPPPSLSYHLFGIAYSVIAVGVSGGAAYLLHARRAALS